jgi:AP2 domain
MTPQTEYYRIIPLTQGQVALVDEADYKRLSKWKWHAQWDDKKNSFYAVHNMMIGSRRDPGPRQRGISMHRMVLHLSFGDKRKAEHKNGFTLDNRRNNLRFANHAQNLQNRGKTRANTSGFKGVSLRKMTGKWQAKITVNGSQIYLGVFLSAQEASNAYKAAAIRLHGEFAHD